MITEIANGMSCEPILRDQVRAIEKAMISVSKGAIFNTVPIENAEIVANIELIVKHYFSYGVYARELFIPKHTILCGQIHKYQNLNILVKGKLDILIDNKIKQVEAPFIVVSPPGTKRIARALEDSIWITIHGTNETDLNKIEDCFIAQSEEEWLEFCKNEPMLPLNGEQKCLI